MDSMTFTKAGGALCGALLIFLLGKWAAEAIYSPYGDVAQAYSIETGAGGAAAVEEETVSFDEIFAAADPSAGERLWRQCSACHALEENRHGTGPSMFGVVGRDKGAIDGFRYSGALASAEGAWEPENLDGFLANPRGYLPGTTMAYAGMRRAEDRANLIAYLATFN